MSYLSCFQLQKSSNLWIGEINCSRGIKSRWYTEGWTLNRENAKQRFAKYDHDLLEDRKEEEINECTCIDRRREHILRTEVYFQNKTGDFSWILMENI